MAQVKKIGLPKVTASSRPCAFISPDPGNAPAVAPKRPAVRNESAASDSESVLK
jgi:hypothetical protein